MSRVQNLKEETAECSVLEAEKAQKEEFNK